MVNTVFDDRFQIEGEIARNDRAWIYRGTDLRTGKPVAVKVLRPWTLASEKLESRFEQEFQVLRALDHPHIVRVLQTGLTPNKFHYFAMELLQGETLSKRLVDRGALPPIKVAEYLDQIASALDAAHAKGIIHRDINPGNVMLHQSSSGRDVVKVLDFGLAKHIQEGNEAQAQLTGAGISVGTPAYMSPEQAMGQSVGASSDVYSLGVLAYKMLSGVVPFERPTDYATMVAHVTDPVPPMSSRGVALGNGLEALIQHALAKDPAQRPASAGELARRFREALGGSTAAPTGPSSHSGIPSVPVTVTATSATGTGSGGLRTPVVGSGAAAVAAARTANDTALASSTPHTASGSSNFGLILPLLIALGLAVMVGGLVLAVL